MKITTLKSTFSDHVPVLTKIETNEEVPIHSKRIVKRSFKNFTQDKWNQSLGKKDWTSLSACSDIDLLVKKFTSNITESLDELAPIKTFIVRSHHKFGVSEETKKLMIKRDNCRSQMKGASAEARQILHVKYKQLRNKT